MKDQFDEIQSPEALREECRSLFSQIQMHQKQIAKLNKDLSDSNEMLELCVSLNSNSVHIPKFNSAEEFVAWVNE